MTASHEQTTPSELLTGAFRDRASAEQAYHSLTTLGYTKEDINVFMSAEVRKRHFTETDANTELVSKATEHGLAGATIGGAVGAIAGVLAIAGTLVIPGLGIVVAGPVAAGLAGLGAGAAAGGLLGALVGAGVPEERAKIYEADIESGSIVVGVRPRSNDDATAFEREWTGYQGQNIHR